MLCIKMTLDCSLPSIPVVQFPVKVSCLGWHVETEKFSSKLSTLLMLILLPQQLLTVAHQASQDLLEQFLLA